MPVAKSPLAASEKFDFLAVFRDFGDEVAGLGVEHGCSYRHLDYPVFSILTERTARAAALSVGSEDVTLVPKREEGPHMAVTFQNDVAAASTVATVRSPLWDVFSPVEMTASRSTLAGAA